ncbi:15-methylpalmitoyl-4-hydroxy-2-pyrone synthase [Oceanobacillus limi]|uniref:15-methylpalmitoyl-4-hydroxy-2-pyrone synthase n=1 Tax=Oceanobacillus limi TaxID=930131 RepID=A0A1H9ZES7_9BACI|nr:3-oxoacyl-[acyl-carrier-protein] synthase III C-terminal domain-containing protein [Oceanobacillus limi]SES79560.1 15-methylpalmitoyl-4-hydroxy-2-pyrone synthase [Oceanobacillus limi]
MASICSIGLGVPKYNLSQNKIKGLVENIFTYSTREINRLLPVFDNANIKQRQFVVDQEWFTKSHSFEEKNDLYKKLAVSYSLEAIDNCLKNKDYLNEEIPYEAIDMIVFVSSTGIATPSIDVHLMNERSFRPDISRMPLWGLGCAGGAIGLSRAYDWLSSHPDKTVLVVCCELCSLTFQKDDRKKSNLVGTALFGDGVGALLLAGEKSPYIHKTRTTIPTIVKTSSYTQKDSMSIMGWKITNLGFEVVFSKSIPAQVRTIWKDHVTSFLKRTNKTPEQLHSFIAHPGGKKVLDAMEESFAIPEEKLKYSNEVLANHGNMSSPTVIYVLDKWMKGYVPRNEKSIISALGPGFSSELLMLDWN